jgi:hypothetical protein
MYEIKIITTKNKKKYREKESVPDASQKQSCCSVSSYQDQPQQQT